MTPKGTAVFLDTTIQVARFLHSHGTQERIRNRIAGFTLRVTSAVVKQEFKRRVLGDAKYLLNKLNDCGSFGKLYDRVLLLPPPQGKKLSVCLSIFREIFADESDASLTDRLRLRLHYLLTLAMSEFEDSVDSIQNGSKCGCAAIPVREIASRERYDLGTNKCSKAPSGCGIVGFLKEREAELASILKHIQSLPTKSDELARAEKFIALVLEKPEAAPGLDPCLKVGDLIIALESVGIPCVYTMNGRESQHLCRVLGQSMIVRPQNWDSEDVVCEHSASEWPEF